MSNGVGLFCTNLGTKEAFPSLFMYTVVYVACRDECLSNFSRRIFSTGSSNRVERCSSERHTSLPWGAESRLMMVIQPFIDQSWLVYLYQLNILYMYYTINILYIYYTINILYIYYTINILYMYYTIPMLYIYYTINILYMYYTINILYMYYTILYVYNGILLLYALLCYAIDLCLKDSIVSMMTIETSKARGIT